MTENYATCGACDAPLTDPVSIAAGMGPDCRKQHAASVLRDTHRRHIAQDDRPLTERRAANQALLTLMRGSK